MKFLNFFNFCRSFLALLYLDPGSESGSRLNESGSEKLLNTTPGQKRETDLVECPLPDGGPLGQVQAGAGGEGQSNQIKAVNSVHFYQGRVRIQGKNTPEKSDVHFLH